MDDIHALFARADPRFYDHPRPVQAIEPFEVPEPDEWELVTDDVWTHHGPIGRVLPDQGWKVHVSATPVTARTVLNEVVAHCHATSTPFKHLRDGTQLALALSKDADRASSGKFITIYPADEASLHRTLVELEKAMGGLPGPYILSDLRWANGPLFVRYGAFRRDVIVRDGIDMLAVRDLASGELVPDVRSVAFTVPAWVRLPDFLGPHLEALASPPPAGFPEVTGALSYSNAGGVYEARRLGLNVVLKEARPHAGYTPDGRDAVTRLRDETSLLVRLDGVDVPRVLGTHDAFGHEFLVLERVEGIPLAEAVVARHPLIHPYATVQNREQYRAWALKISQKVRAAVLRLHTSGHTHGDLHPRNVLIDAEDQVTLIDLEMSVPVDAASPATIGAAGFVPATPRPPVARDLYAMACIDLFMYLPLLPLLALDPSKPAQLLAAAAAQFHLDQEWVSSRTAVLQESSGDRPITGADLVAGIVQGLRLDMTPERHDRLWPGDPAQFTEPANSLAHGALGVLVALHHADSSWTDVQRSWVKRALLASTRPGLMDGHAGASWALSLIGDETVAAEQRARIRALSLQSLPSDLYSGLPGVALALLHGAEKDPVLLDAAIEAARILTDRLAVMTPEPQVSTGKGGLMFGATGTALFALRLFEHTGDTSHLQLAKAAIDHDLATLVDGGDGTLNVNEGWRALPYLGSGSAGIGAVLTQLLRHRPDDGRHLEALAGITRSALPQFSIQSGLLQGRAGLIHFLILLEQEGHGSPATNAALAAHMEAFTLHALRVDGVVRFAGDGLLRASSDLGTGSAGVLTAILAYRSHDHGAAPSFSGIPFLSSPRREHPLALRWERRTAEGGENSGIHSLATSS